MDLRLNINDEFLNRYHDQCLLIYYNPEDIEIDISENTQNVFCFKVVKKSNELVLFRFVCSYSKVEAISFMEKFLTNVASYVASNGFDLDSGDSPAKSSVLSQKNIKKLVQKLN